MWKSSRQSIRWIAGLTLLATVLAGGLVACGAADDSGDDRLSRLDRRETREAREERDERRTARADSAGDRSERIGSLFQRRSLEEPVEAPAATAALPAPAATAALPAAVPATALPAAAEATASLRGFIGRDDHSDDIDGATALSSSRPARGDLETEGDADYFSFRAERGVRYVIETASDFYTDTFIELHDGNGYVMESDDDGGTDGGSRITWTAPDDGTYYVAVMGFGGSGTGTYELSLGDLRERLRSALRISLGASIESRLGDGSDADYYSFRADGGVRYVIETRLLSHPDTIMELMDSTGYQIEFDDDGGTDGGSRIEWTAPDDGTYYVVVAGYDGSGTGTYELRLEEGPAALATVAPATVPAPRVFNGRDDHSDDIDGATALSSSRPTRGDLETRGDADYFSFRAERGVRYVIETTSDFSTDTFITLLDGSYEMESDDDGGTDGGSRITWTAPDDGTYYVAVTGYANATGMYELSLGDLRERLRSAARISPGASIEGRLGEGSDEDYYSFRADRGVYYDIEAHLLTHPDTVMRLFDSDGYEIASNDDGGADGGSRIRWEANEDGTYYIVVSAFDSDYTGSYRLTLER